MYLNQLSKEQQELFIDICIHAATSNNNFAEEQKAVIRQYHEEMLLTDIRYTANHDLENAVTKLAEISSNKELRAITLELMALILADNQFDELEKKFMGEFADKVNLEQEVLDQMEILIDELTSVYAKIDRIVFEVD